MKALKTHIYSLFNPSESEKAAKAIGICKLLHLKSRPDATRNIQVNSQRYAVFALYTVSVYECCINAVLM